MNVIYVCRVSKFQAAGNQIDISKEVATEFFKVPLVNIEKSKNTGINICHISDVKSFETIEIQPATNLRWSTKLNKFLSDKGERLSEGDLLIFEKLGRSYCVRKISTAHEKYDAIIEFFDEAEKHLLLSSSMAMPPKEKDEIQPNLLPYLTAIRTKPFLLLAGISGTGKSRIVRKLAQATNDIDFKAEYDGEERWKRNNPTNFCLIQVKPNWHNSMDVVGFKSNIGGAHYEFTQTTLLFLGLLTFPENMLLGLGIMLAANEVPRIAQNFGLDTSTRVNIMSAVHTTTTAINLTRAIAKK